MAAVTLKKFGCFFVFFMFEYTPEKIVGLPEIHPTLLLLCSLTISVQWVLRALLCSLGGPLWSNTAASREKRRKWWLVLIKTIVCFGLKAKHFRRKIYEIKSNTLNVALMVLLRIFTHKTYIMWQALLGNWKVYPVIKCSRAPSDPSVPDLTRVKHLRYTYICKYI